MKIIKKIPIPFRYSCCTLMSSSTGFSSVILSLSLLHRGRLRINSLPYTFLCVLLLLFFISPQGVSEMKLLQNCNLSTKMLIISQYEAGKLKKKKLWASSYSLWCEILEKFFFPERWMSFQWEWYKYVFFLWSQL